MHWPAQLAYPTDLARPCDAAVAGGEAGGDIHLDVIERFLVLEPGAALVLANLSVTGGPGLVDGSFQHLLPGSGHACCPAVKAVKCMCASRMLR